VAVFGFFGQCRRKSVIFEIRHHFSFQ